MQLGTAQHHGGEDDHCSPLQLEAEGMNLAGGRGGAKTMAYSLCVPGGSLSAAGVIAVFCGQGKDPKQFYVLLTSPHV